MRQGVIIYDNNVLEDNTYSNFYNNLNGDPDSAKPGLYRGYSMSNNWDFIYATYLKIASAVSVDTMVGYFDANGGTADPVPFDPLSPFIRYRMNIWSSLPPVGTTYMPANTNSFTGDVFSSDCVLSLAVPSDTGVARVFQNGSTDPIWRVTLFLAEPVTLPAGEYFFSHDATIVMPIARKTDVVALLEGAGTGKHVTRRFDKALESVQASLSAEYGQDDARLTDRGRKVFNEENKALEELRKVSTDKRANASERATALTAIAELTAADAALALQVIQDAKAAADAAGCTPTDSSCEKTLSEITKAEDAYGAGAALSATEGWKAVDRFKMAWEHAMKALGRVPEP